MLPGSDFNLLTHKIEFSVQNHFFEIEIKYAEFV